MLKAKMILMSVNLCQSTRSKLPMNTIAHHVRKVGMKCFRAQKTEMNTMAGNLF